MAAPSPHSFDRRPDIFRAARLNLKSVEIPVRYFQRTYGTTQISRFRHRWASNAKSWFRAHRMIGGAI